jgi:hypothetical protein
VSLEFCGRISARYRFMEVALRNPTDGSSQQPTYDKTRLVIAQRRRERKFRGLAAQLITMPPPTPLIA